MIRNVGDMRGWPSREQMRKNCGLARDERLGRDWTERRGPAPKVPEGRGRGFGSRLIAMGLVRTQDSELRYTSEGFAATFRAPLEQMQQP